MYESDDPMVQYFLAVYTVYFLSWLSGLALFQWLRPKKENLVVLILVLSGSLSMTFAIGRTVLHVLDF